MGNFTKVFSIVALFFMLMFTPDSAKASHFKGGDIYFECLGGGTYRLVFTCYYSCENFSIAPSSPSSIFWDLTSTCPGVPASVQGVTATSSQLTQLSLYCRNIRTSCDFAYSNGNVPAGTPDGTLFYKYVSETFTIPAGCTVTASVEEGSRNSAITNLVNPGSENIHIDAMVTTPANDSCQSNPEFATTPVNIFCVNENATFSQGAIDFNGDSLVYALVNPLGNGAAPITYVAGCSATNPMGAPNTYASVFNFDTRTGNINFTPTQTGNYVMAVKVFAYRNGALVSTTTRDIQILVIPCTTQNRSPVLLDRFTPATVTGATIYDSTNIGVCPGQLLQFHLRATDPDSLNYVRDSTNLALVLPGSVVSVTHSGTAFDTTTLNVSWTPQRADSGFHYFYLTVADTFCPRPGSNVYPFIISVLGDLTAGPNQFYCNGGVPVTIQAHGAVHYTWSDSATGGPPRDVVSYSADSSSITVAPSVPNVSVGYVVVGDLIGGCKNADTVMVKNVPKFTLSVTALDSTICKYTTTTVTATATPTSVGPYIYSWTPAALVSSPTSASTSITPLRSNAYYTVKVSAIGGCVISDSVPVSIDGSAPRITITPSNNNVCPGDTVNLNAIAFTENLVNCGLIDTCADPSILSNGTIGADTSASTSIETPYSGVYSSARTQYLIRASELNAAGISSGTITDIAFFVKEINSSVPYDNFTVSMGCTSLDSLTSYVSGLQVCAPPAAVIPNSGYSPHPFTHFYNWDGASNLVIQVCYTRSSTSSNSSDFVSFTTTPYSGSVLYSRDFGSGADGCTLTSFPSISNQRPTIRMGLCTPDVLTYQWTPATIQCDVCPNTQIVVPSDGTYTLTVHDRNCVNDTSVTVITNRNIAINATPDTTLCSADTVRLNVGLVNPPPSVCLKNYILSSIPYRAILATANTIPTTSYLGSGGFASTDDGTAGPFNIGFPFQFYCQSYSQMYVNTNAWISFINPYPASVGTLQYYAQTFPPTAPFMNPLHEIALMVGDYAVSSTSTVSYFTTGTAPSRVCVIRFNSLRSLSGSYTTTGEIHLYEGTGVVEIMINSSNYTGTNHTTGIKDSTGVGQAAPGRNNQPYTISTPEGWRFVPQNGPSVVTGTTVWTPNVALSDDSVLSPLAYPSAPQTYYVDEYLTINKFTNPSVCHVRDSVKVGINTFTHSTTASPLTVCPGDTSRLMFTAANPIASYSWTPAGDLSSPSVQNPLATVYDTTRYIVTATDANGCRAIDSVTVNVFPTPKPHVSSSATICYTDSVQLSVAGSYATYQWVRITATGRDTLGTGPTLYVHPSGAYQVRVMAAGSTCYYFSDTAFIDSFPHPLLHVTPSGPDSFCVGGNVVLQVDQGYNTYSWTPAGGAAQNVPVQTSGDYSYTAQDVHGCHLYSDTAFVRATVRPSTTLNDYQNPICRGDSTIIIATTDPAGIPVSWYLAGTQIASGNPLVTTTAGSYSVIADMGCPDTVAFVLTVASKPTVALDIPGPISVCGCDTMILVTAIVTPSATGDTYLWSADSSAAASYGIDSTGTYAVTVSDINHCTATTSITATVTCPQVTTTAEPGTIFASDTGTLTVLPVGATVLTSYQWTPAGYVFSPNTSSTGFTGQHTGIDTFYVTVVDNNGCSNTVPVYITVIEKGDFRMPSAFTPNGDGKNDRFYPVLSGSNSSKVLAFRIYNRWGQLVYDNPDAPGWDGAFGGSVQATDTYLYFVTIESPDPADASKRKTKSVEGSFQLFR